MSIFACSKSISHSLSHLSSLLSLLSSRSIPLFTLFIIYLYCLLISASIDSLADHPKYYKPIL
jgi:hypothetical protein